MRQCVTGIQYVDSKEAFMGWGVVVEDDNGGFSASIDTWGYVITESLRQKLDGQRHFASIGVSKQDAIDKLQKILSDVFETTSRVHVIPLG